MIVCFDCLMPSINSPQDTIKRPMVVTSRNTQLTQGFTRSDNVRTLLYLAVVLASLFSAFGHASTSLVITGVEGNLEENIRLLVQPPPERDNQRQFKRYVDGLPEQVVTALSAYGYYAAEVSVSVAEVSPPAPKKGAGKVVEKVEAKIEGNPAPATGQKATVPAKEQTSAESAQTLTTLTQVTIAVTLNKPVTIQAIALDIAIADEDKADFAAILKTQREQLAKGNVFVSSNYEAAKSALLNRAQELGYFDFEFTSAEVRVSRRAYSADIKLQASAGQRYNFGQILYRQRTFSDVFMNRWAPFAEGDPYQASLIGELTQNLQSSGYFSSVRVRPLVDPRYKDIVPVTVDLTQQDQNQISVGIGYSTDTEFRTKLTWGRPLINSRGHSAEFGISVSRYIQSASFSYRIPRDTRPLFNYWGIEYGIRNEQLRNQVVDDSDSFNSTLNFQRVTRTSKDWNESIFLRWERERFDIGGVESETDLVMPGISYSRSRSKGQPFPEWGQALSFQIMGGSKDALSTIDILKAVGRFRYLRAVSNRNTLIATLQYGAIRSNNYDLVPLSQRFFAGGDRTVRGYRFKDISPRNLKGDPVGGRYLEVMSAEYNYRFVDRWSGALFVDAGRAFNNFDDSYSVGAGFGLRWLSPVGPFRIDLGIPINSDNDDDYRIHLSLGPDL